jgi:2'-5' RNA ligase
LQALAASLCHGLEGRPIAPSNLHLTLKFLGDCDNAQVAGLVADLNQLEAAAFTLHIDCSGWWGRSQIAWLGCADVPTGCLSLAGILEKFASDHGVSRASKAFHPHITIARKVPHFEAGVLPEPLVWPVADFALVASALDHTGARYSVTHRWSLITPGLADTTATPV